MCSPATAACLRLARGTEFRRVLAFHEPDGAEPPGAGGPMDLIGWRFVAKFRDARAAVKLEFDTGDGDGRASVVGHELTLAAAAAETAALPLGSLAWDVRAYPESGGPRDYLAGSTLEVFDQEAR